MRAIAFGALWFVAFAALAQWAPGFMHDSLYRDFTVGHALALSQFAMIALVAWAQLGHGELEHGF